MGLSAHSNEISDSIEGGKLTGVYQYAKTDTVSETKSNTHDSQDEGISLA
jgi:hypothetical protein